jgi:uncharacterized protein (UPF0262 family)
VTGEGKQASEGRLVAVEFDEAALRRSTAYIDHERGAAIRDLLAENVFTPVGRSGKVFRLYLSAAGRRLMFDVRDTDDRPVVGYILSMTPLHRIVRDYYVICEAYYGAVGSASPAQFEAIDMGRRGMHNEGAEMLRERLKGKIDVDEATARNLFTLVASLYWRGVSAVHNRGDIR